MGLEPGSLRARLQSSTDQAWRLYCALEVVIPFREAPRNDGIRTSRQRLVASTIPWDTNAASLLMELHVEVRRLEVHLKEKVTGQLTDRRGGSADNTQYALKALTKLAEAVDDQTVLSVLNVVDRWNRKTDNFFHPEKGLHRVPRSPKEEELRCPYCEFQTMRWHPGTGIIVCVNPDCLNESGVRPRWEARFVLQDDALAFSWEALSDAA